MKLIIILFFASSYALNYWSNQLSDYSNCLWNNCQELRIQCGQDCATTAEVVNIKQSSEYCVTGTGDNRVKYYATCAGLIANATSGTVQSYYKCLESCFTSLLITLSTIYFIL